MLVGRPIVIKHSNYSIVALEMKSILETIIPLFRLSSFVAPCKYEHPNGFALNLYRHRIKPTSIKFFILRHKKSLLQVRTE